MSIEQTDYQLDDRYEVGDATAFLTGIQALARIPVEQLRLDRRQGLNTAAFVSGYPGSPLGGFDQEMARAARHESDLPIHCRPAVNEELGAAAVMGSQLAATQPDFRYDGVLGIWYGKAPGLDRAGDTLRHAVFGGTSRQGGAIALVGDDPAAKSSSLPSSSDATLVDLKMPVFYPGDVQEIVELGRHAVALSRVTGVWSSMKIVAAVADGSGTVDLSPARMAPRIPDLTIDGQEYEHEPSAFFLPPYTLELEREFRTERAELVRRYAAANRLNEITVDPGDGWIGLVATGYTYHELREALRRIGLVSDDDVAAAGVRLLHLEMPVPLDYDTVRRFARGLDEVLVVEEKNPTLEIRVRDALYRGPDQPLIVGKTHEDGRELMPSYGMLDADTILPGLRVRLERRIADRLAPEPPAPRGRALIPLTVNRIPYFCSGCPHNWGTKVPDDSLVGAGIGCHAMALNMPEERVGNYIGDAAMGSEGVPWIGMAPFVERDHFIQNLGDGTFFHSGQLAIQASVAAGVNVTYKLLYNGTVAMTGGQDAVGAVGVPGIATIVLAHGVSDVLITTDDPSRYRGVSLPAGVEVWDRARIVEAQERLAEVPGVTVLIHDQACAAETRRARKRGRAVTPGQRVVINHRICEGCGDCGVVSNCLSVQPLETPLGRKTTIDQTTCNFDYSCLGGDCPAFMKVEVGDVAGSAGTAFDGELPEPEPRNREHCNIRMVGIGGTGVVTAAQVLATAAMIDGFEVRGLDQTGLSQKAGPVTSDLRLSREETLPSNLVGETEADVIVGFDLLVAAGDHTLLTASQERTAMISSTTATAAGSMIGHPEIDYPAVADLRARVEATTRAADNRYVDAGAITSGLFASTATSNIFMLGVAVQAGLVPVRPDAIAQAIELNGVVVATNLASFAAGRRWYIDPVGVEAAAGNEGGVGVVVPELPAALATRISHGGHGDELAERLRLLTADLVGYQDEAYAVGYLDTVESVAAAERRVDPASDALTHAVADGLHKLLAYKDEYEVARLLLGPEGETVARSVGGAEPEVQWMLHPPMLKALGLDDKIAVPAKLGRPLMRALARGKRLRGTRLDPFGRAEVRRVEQSLPGELRDALHRILPELDADNLADAVRIARLPDDVRGYEDLKLERAATFRAELARSVAGFG